MKLLVPCGLLAALLVLPVAGQESTTLPELSGGLVWQRIAVAEVDATGFSDVLGELATREGILARSDTLLVSGPEQPPILVTELDDSGEEGDRLFSFFLVDSGEALFLQLRTSAIGIPEMRLWGEGPSEIVAEGSEVRLLPQPSEHTFRVPRTGWLTNGSLIAAPITASDTIRCIARFLGIGLDRTSLERYLASALCSATSAISLVLTVTNCLSIPGIGSNLVFATLGCITGVTKLIACGYLSCGASSCPVESIQAGTPVAGSWTASCESTHRSGRFAKLYSFTLNATTSVTIDLTSSVDPYLFLLQGSGAIGNVLTRDDNSGPGLDARISRTLGPGTYTIEATTFASGKTGSFTLTLSRR